MRKVFEMRWFGQVCTLGYLCFVFVGLFCFGFFGLEDKNINFQNKGASWNVFFLIYFIQTQVVKKLAGHVYGTTAWATNVGNEHGQVLMSVLTAAEGHGLDRMANGLVARYQAAGVPPPQLLYVNRDCCSTKSHLFTDWPAMQVRLDILHFMRRFSAGCLTDSHQLYPFFLRQLSGCIFSWSAEDVDLLKRVRRARLVNEGIKNPSEEVVSNSIGKKTLARHCRRTTRGVEETTRLIKALLTNLDGEQGKDTLGVPLFDSTRIWEIWASQEKHIACIQDPQGVLLYTKTGETVVDGVALPIFRCARGSTSLESFHLHFNRFIPGEAFSIVSIHFCLFSLSAKTCLNMTTVFFSSLITLCRNDGQWPPLSSLPDGWACSVECRPCCRCHNHWVSRTSGVQWLSAVCCGPTGAACARQEDKPNPYHPPEIHRCVLRSFYFWLSWLMKIFTNCALRNTGSILWTHREQSIISERRLKTGINITYKSTCLHISSLMEFPTSIFHFI